MASDMRAPLRGATPDSSPPASPSGNSYSPSRNHYTVNCNLAEHKLLKPVQSDSPRRRGMLYKCLAVAAAVAVVVAVVGYSIGGTAGSGSQNAPTASQAAALQNSTGAATAVPAQASPLQAGSANSSSSADGSADRQQAAGSGSQEPMAPADLKHMAASEEDPVAAVTQQDDCLTPESSQSDGCREVLQWYCAKAHSGRCAQCSEAMGRPHWCLAPTDPDRMTTVNGWPVPKAGYQPADVPGGAEPCPPGSVKDTAGTQLCAACTGRTFQDAAGQTDCAPCPEAGTVSADHQRCTFPRKAAIMSSRVHTLAARDDGPSSTADSTGEAGQPLKARPKLAHLPAAVADALASLDLPTSIPAAATAKEHYNRKAATAEQQPAAVAASTVRHYNRGT